MTHHCSVEKALAKRPDYVVEKLGADSKVCLINSKHIFDAMKDKEAIIMTCNTRIKLVIPGIMKAAEELDAVVGFELAKTEGNVDGGYTGQDPKTYFETVTGYAKEINFTKPFFIHGDHITVKDTSQEAIDEAKCLIAAELEAGYTSFAIDASFNELPDNIKITAELVKPIVEKGIGLEVEVGEVKAAGKEATLTTIEEAVEFISSLDKLGVHPNLLAINNGSKHGNYLAGEKVLIDLDRTGEIAKSIEKYGVCIAQHGITGTPLSIVGSFADYGIRKGNVGTVWQNIAHKGLPEDLMAKLKKWAEDNNKDIKFATKPHKAEIDNVGDEYKEKIIDLAYQEARDLIKAFRAEGTASYVCENMQ